MFKTKQWLEDFETKLPEKFSLFKKMSPKRSKRKQNLSFSCHLVHHKPQSERERDRRVRQRKRRGVRVKDKEQCESLRWEARMSVCAQERRESEGVCE